MYNVVFLEISRCNGRLRSASRICVDADSVGTLLTPNLKAWCFGLDIRESDSNAQVARGH
jgi:hypothetical protein